MLLITRRRGEKLLINKGQIQIEVTYVGRGSVGLGIKAPSHIDVDREEIFLKKQMDSKRTDLKGQE